MNVGKNAARAMPTCSLASATRRSAAAMSGRRSINCDGKPTGIKGGAVFKARSDSENSAGALPVSTAMACSNAARCTPSSISCARVVSSCVRACANRPGIQAALKAVAREVDGLLVRDKRIFKQPFLRIERSDLEIIGRDFRVDAEAKRFEIARSRLCFGTRCVDGATNSTPHIGLIRDIGAQQQIAIR